jgi:hypothetical protein
MPRSEDVLPLSTHLYVLGQSWPRNKDVGMPMHCLSRAGCLLDEARRRAGERRLTSISWHATPTPVGPLYRKSDVNALFDSMRVLAGLTDALPASDLLTLMSVLESVCEEGTPLLRPYRYVEEALQDVATVIVASKIFVFRDTELGEESEVLLPNVSALWAFGESLPMRTVSSSPPPFQKVTIACLEHWLRMHEQQLMQAQMDESGSHGELDRVLAWDAQINPQPDPAAILPSRAELLWQPRRLTTIDIDRLLRWLDSQPLGTAPISLTRILSFFRSAQQEYAEVMLDAYCTDSPEAQKTEGFWEK